MFDVEVGYKTGSGNVMSVGVVGVLYDRYDIFQFMLDGYVGAYCNAGDGCKGHNGGCPPYAPTFDALWPSYDLFYVLCVQFDMAWAIKYSGWWKGVSAPGLYILVYADRLTMNYMQRILKMFEREGYHTLGTSNCPGCRPKDCTVLITGKCSKPKKRRFSIEATGVDCSQLHNDIYDEELPWWYRTPEHMPTYMFRYAGVFGKRYDDWLAYDRLLKSHVYGDKSYCSIDECPEAQYVIENVPIVEHDTVVESYRIPVELMEKRKNK